MTTVTKELTSVDENLKKFLQKCDDKKFSNNNTLDSMKFDWCLDVGGMWFATYRNNDIISLSGIHPWKMVDTLVHQKEAGEHYSRCSN